LRWRSYTVIGIGLKTVYEGSHPNFDLMIVLKSTDFTTGSVPGRMVDSYGDLCSETFLEPIADFYGRPLLGMVFLREDMLKTGSNKATIYNNLLRGVLQVMAFNYESLNGKFVSAGVRLAAASILDVVGGILYVKTPKVMAFARSHFGCQSSAFIGLPLNETQAWVVTSKQLHWNKRYAFFDVYKL